jgi:hypothetical protein
MRDFLVDLIGRYFAFAGLPEGAPGDRTPNWIVCSWPPETSESLSWQWREKLIPYWRQLAEFAVKSGVIVVTHDEKIFNRFDPLYALREGALERRNPWRHSHMPASAPPFALTGISR